VLIPETLPSLQGHVDQQKQILNAYHSARFPHAWILRGPKGVGKYNFALHLAYGLFQGELEYPLAMDQSAPLFKRMKSGGHGDLIILTRLQDEKGKVAREITADQVRSIHGKLAQTSYEGGWRVVIVDGVEYLNRFGANALLKVLEEPPQKTLFLLITSSLGRLLPTIRSRAQVLNFNALLDDEMRNVVERLTLSLSANDVETLLPLSQGSPGRFVHLMNLGGVQFCQEMVKAFAHLKSGSLKEALSFAYAHAEDPEIFEVIEDFIRSEIAENALRLASNDNASEKLKSQLKIWDQVTELFQDSRKADLDKKAALSAVIGSLS